MKHISPDIESKSKTLTICSQLDVRFVVHKQSHYSFGKAIHLLTCIVFIMASPVIGQIHQPGIPQAPTYQPINLNINNQYALSKSFVPKQPDIILEEQKHIADQHKENDIIKEEINNHNRYVRQKTITLDTIRYNQYKHAFENALQQLKTLNANSRNPSLSDAFYITENAFGNPYLTKSEYENIINKSVSFIKLWMKQNNFDEKDNEAKHLAIQKFMSEKLTVSESITNKDGKTTIKTSTHLPFFYDFIDYEAKQNHRNFFLTKCLATGGGQCNSMPMVYLVLAERLDAKTFLSYAPQHSFIKYPKNNGEIENYEATSNWHINDLWYQDHLFINQQAIRSGIYLDTLSKQKIVANCMLDLAFQYIRKMPIDNGKFLQNCLREAYKYYPKQNNIYSYFIYSEYLKGLLQLGLGNKKITDIAAIQKNEYLSSIQVEYQKNEAYIKQLGYTEMPKDIYEAMLKEHEFKGVTQRKYNISGKEKRNPFIETNK